MPHAPVRLRVAALVAGLVTVVSGLVTAAPAHALNKAGNVATPGNFTGYGFDQCLAPNQAAMDAWLRSSPFWAVGIYISGDSRACPSQPNLTPTWVSTQLANGWRLLPITLGPQAWCTSRDRYKQQVRISPSPARGYAAALAQGRAEADKSVQSAAALGLAAGSTLWYDLEGDFSTSRTDCRESALTFLSGWTTRLHELGYVSGFYSSAGTGIKMLDDAASLRPGTFAMPDQLWVARWSGTPTGSTSPASPTCATPAGPPTSACTSTAAATTRPMAGSPSTSTATTSTWAPAPSRAAPRPSAAASASTSRVYAELRKGSEGDQVKAAQCLLRMKKKYDGQITGVYDRADPHGGEGLPRQDGLPRPWGDVQSRVDLDPLQGPAPADEVRRRRPRRTPSPARPQRRRPGPPRRQRRLRGDHDGCGEEVPGGHRCPPPASSPRRPGPSSAAAIGERSEPAEPLRHPTVPRRSQALLDRSAEGGRERRGPGPPQLTQAGR